MEKTSKFFQSAISVNCVVFGYNERDLRVLLIEREFEPFQGLRALPGGLIYPDEDLDKAVEYILDSVTGMSGIYRQQLMAFANTDRHPSGRVVSIAYLCLLPMGTAELKNSSFAKAPKWFPYKERPSLVFDHNDIVESSYQRLQSLIRIEPVAFELLEPQFTLPELQSLFETVLNTEFDKRNFRRKLNDMDFIEDSGEFQKNNLHRPAKLYGFDKEKYGMAKEKGFIFSI